MIELLSGVYDKSPCGLSRARDACMTFRAYQNELAISHLIWLAVGILIISSVCVLLKRKS